MISMMPGVDGDAVNAATGLVGSGSTSPALGRQPVVLAVLNVVSKAASEKSPLRCKGVGTCAVLTTCVFRRFHSSDTKKNALSLMTGPPAENPKSCLRMVFFLDLGSVALRIGSFASRRSLRPK